MPRSFFCSYIIIEMIRTQIYLVKYLAIYKSSCSYLATFINNHRIYMQLYAIPYKLKWLLYMLWTFVVLKLIITSSDH